MGRDRLSALDDNLLSFHILSKLPLRDAVRCSILSRRWRLLWTLLPHLKIWNADFNAKVIDNIFCFHHGELESLEISFIYRFSWEERNIDDLIWKSVRAASVKRVKQITLRKAGSKQHVPAFGRVRAPSSGRVRVPSSLFSCDCLTFLKIENFEIKVPSYFSGFRFLRTCILSFFHNIDDILEQIAAKCPLLENLRVVSCYVVRLNHVEISALNLKYLNFSGNHYISSLTLNCPKLMNVTIHDSPSMLRLELNSCRDLHFSTTELHLLEGLSNRNSLRKITLDGWSTRLPSLTVLGCFSNLEELAIESKSFEVRKSLAFIF
jgi:hypothetical protein